MTWASLMGAVLPAYAGMIPQGQKRSMDRASAPRVCGDDPYDLTEINLPIECSPRMRG